MKKKKSPPEASVAVSPNFEIPEPYELFHDTLVVKIISLRLPDEDPKHFRIKVTYFDQVLLSGTIMAIGGKDAEQTKPLIEGTMTYDPSDYAKMCMFADFPLVVNIRPLRTSEIKSVQTHQHRKSDEHALRSSITLRSDSLSKHDGDISCCNVDILRIFLCDEANPRMCVKKRMEPMIKPSVLHCKSWDCLPLLTMELTAERHAENAEHHEILKAANWMKLTLVGTYNMPIPFDNDYEYTAASKTPLFCESNTELATFNRGYRVPRRFDPTSFYPKWESLRIAEDSFTRGDKKFTCDLRDIRNDDDIDLNYYIKRKLPNNVVWGSFHRSLLINKLSEKWLSKHIRKYKWPLEVHMYAEESGYSFMAFLDLFQLLYPGEERIRLAVPLQWISASYMMHACNCPPLLTPNDKAPSSIITTTKPSRMLTDATSSTGQVTPTHGTGSDGQNAFVIVEVKLRKPLKKIYIPPHIPPKDLDNMLKDLEAKGLDKRICTGRGQLVKDWQAIVRMSAASLRKVPYHGITELCAFNRQLSETRTRVELITSYWQEAAIYVNNNFVVQEFLHSDDLFEEMVLMSHAHLMKTARDCLLGGDHNREGDPVLRAARQARQMQDTYHAMELYLQVAVKRPNDGNSFRELSTCLKEIDRDWANACLNYAVVLNPRHPLTLISKGGMVFEEDPGAAEKFFVALLALYPFWTTAWIVASAYYFDRQQYLMSDKILEIVKQSRRDGIMEEIGYSRSWERELGDWWDFTPLLPGMDPFYDAADLLLRLRCVGLAEVCMACILTNSGETSAYYHLVALCCRLRGKYETAICHLHVALDMYGEVGYLRSLEAECLHQAGDIAASMESYEKAHMFGSPFSILMSLPVHKDSQRVSGVVVDLVRRKPSAYAWMALADQWMMKTGLLEDEDVERDRTEDEFAALAGAAAYAVEALKWDRLAGRAWFLLSKIVKPSARRQYCIKMAALCGYKADKDIVEGETDSQQSTCYLLGKPVAKCRCRLCEFKGFKGIK